MSEFASAGARALSLTPLPLGLPWLQGIDFPRKLGICERLFGARLAAHGICWIETAAGIPWKLDLANATHRWIVYGKYEGSPFLNWARAYLRPESVIVDSGANIGQMLLYLAQYASAGKVLAFEPCSEAADWLEECLLIHGSLPVEIVRAALGQKREHVYMQQVGAAELHGACNQLGAQVGERVAVVRLEDYLEERRISSVDLWKLDVEGHELQALSGAESMLRDQAIKALYVELGFGHGQMIVDYLRTFDYACWLFDGAGRLSSPAHLPEHTNGLFLPRGASPMRFRTEEASAS